jgi:hypothetical protein
MCDYIAAAVTHFSLEVSNFQLNIKFPTLVKNLLSEGFRARYHCDTVNMYINSLYS